MRRLLAIAAVLALGSPAHAVVGGAEDRGPLAQASVMVLSTKPGMCSAVVVAPDVLLTAGHCAIGDPDYRVHYRDESGRPVMIELAAKTIHPGYDPKAIAARRRSIDLALIRLPAPLPQRFSVATLSGAIPEKGAELVMGGWGVAREGDHLSSGTFRSLSLKAVEPYGPSKILVWAQGAGGACSGDSGGPLTRDGKVFAVTTWAVGANGRGCGGTTQGMLLGPQRPWIDEVLSGWGRTARWE